MKSHDNFDKYYVLHCIMFWGNIPHMCNMMVYCTEYGKI